MSPKSNSNPAHHQLTSKIGRTFFAGFSYISLTLNGLLGKHYRKFFRVSVSCLNRGKKKMENAPSIELIFGSASPSWQVAAHTIAEKSKYNRPPQNRRKEAKHLRVFWFFWGFLEAFGDKKFQLILPQTFPAGWQCEFGVRGHDRALELADMSASRQAATCPAVQIGASILDVPNIGNTIL